MEVEDHNQAVKIAIVAFERDFRTAKRIQEAVGGKILPYEREVFKHAFKDFDAIIAIMTTGIVVRKVAPLLRDKWGSPPVVVVDKRLNFAIPIVGGHHGGNGLAIKLHQKVGCLPVITTATEVMGRISVEKIAEQLKCGVLNKESTKSVNAALLEEDVSVLRIKGPKIVVVDENVSVLKKENSFHGDDVSEEDRVPDNSLVVGIGTKRNIKKEEVLEAVSQALTIIGYDFGDIREFATADIKRNEKGLMEAVLDLGKKLSFVSKETIQKMDVPSKSRAEIIGLKSVSEPCALARSDRKQLLMKKRAFGGVTIAIAR